MDIVSAIFGFLKSGLEAFNSVFGKKNSQDMKDRAELRQEQQLDDEIDEDLKENNIDEIRDKM